MKNLIRRLPAICAVMVVFCIGANAQNHETKKRKALRITGKAALFVVKTAAKATFETAKFTGKHIIVPAVKNVAVPIAKAAPPIAAKAVKLTAKGIKNGVKAITDRDEDESDTGASN